METSNLCTGTDVGPWRTRGERLRTRAGFWPGAAPVALGALVTAVLLIAPAGRAESQVDSAAPRIDSVIGYLSRMGRVPLRILYLVERTDSTVSLTLVISGERFAATGVELAADRAVFDWVPGDESVHCELVRADGGLAGDCTDRKGESLHLTMERPGAAERPPGR